MNDLFYYQLTEYPKIYKNVYWGNFKDTINKINDEKNIIENRNNFIREFNIVRTKNLIKKYNNFGWEESDNDRMFDHSESYIDKDKNYILVVSPYYVVNKAEIHKPEVLEFLTQRGFIMYDRLYANSATTFIKKIIT